MPNIYKRLIAICVVFHFHFLEMNEGHIKAPWEMAVQKDLCISDFVTSATEQV